MRQTAVCWQTFEMVNADVKGVVLHDVNMPVFEPMTGSLGNHLIHQPSAGFGQ
jgi:hypothetical protein